MDSIIYRNSDRVIMAYSYPRRTEEATAEQLRLTIENLVDGEGGTADDYTVVQVSKARLPGKEIRIKDDGTVEWVDDSRILAKTENLASASAKLQSLGLTADEVKSLSG